MRKTLFLIISTLFLLRNTSTGNSTRFGTDVDGFIHTQPGFSKKLSEEDKSLESNVDFSCIVFSEVVKSLAGGGVYGLNCWKVTSHGGFEEIDVEVDSR